jgi:hypothetical protein
MLYASLLIAFGAASVSAECTRDALIKARDKFFAAGGSAQAAGVTENAKIALNNKIVPLAQTPASKLTGFSGLNVEAVDTAICQIATFRVSPAQVLSTRLQINSQGQIDEVEFLQAIQGDQFFRPTGFPSTTPAVWSGKAKAGPPPNIPATWTPIGGTPGKDVNKANCKSGAGAARMLTRKELIYVAATYADGLRGEPWGSCIIGSGSCPRNENGVTTSANCAVGAGNFGFLTRGRRWVADTENAVVLGAFFFDYGAAGPKGPVAERPGDKPAGGSGGGTGKGTKLFLHEYFKVEAGKLAGIYAPMTNIPGAQASADTFVYPEGSESGSSAPKSPKGVPKGKGTGPPTGTAPPPAEAPAEAPAEPAEAPAAPQEPASAHAGMEGMDM